MRVGGSGHGLRVSMVGTVTVAVVDTYLKTLENLGGLAEQSLELLEFGRQGERDGYYC